MAGPIQVLDGYHTLTCISCMHYDMLLAVLVGQPLSVLQPLGTGPTAQLSLVASRSVTCLFCTGCLQPQQFVVNLFDHEAAFTSSTSC